MKLTLLRHGKSDWDEPVDDPINRPLKKRGTKDARKMGAFFTHMTPDLIVCSPATRTHCTAKLFAESAGYNKDIKIDKRIYLASYLKLLEVIHEQQANHVLIVGHNPSLGKLISYLDSANGRKITTQLYMVTASAATVAFNDLDNWNKLKENSGQLQAMITPKFLNSLAG